MANGATQTDHNVWMPRYYYAIVRGILCASATHLTASSVKIQQRLVDCMQIYVIKNENELYFSDWMKGRKMQKKKNKKYSDFAVIRIDKTIEQTVFNC